MPGSSSIPQIVTTDTDFSLTTPDDGEDNNPPNSCPPSPALGSSYLGATQHRRSPSDPAYLSPPSTAYERRSSLDLPPLTSSDGHPSDIPPRTPSPQPSVHFAPSTPPPHRTTFLTASNNYTSHRKGSFSSQASSAGESTLASPHQTFSRDDKSSRTHVRTASSTSSKRISDDDAGSIELRPRSPVPSSRGSHEHVDITPGSRRSSGDGDADASNHSPEYTSIDMNEPDPAPFSFRPFQLASMLDPKNLQALKDIGGIDGLLSGLQTDKDAGLGDNVTAVDHGGGGKDDAGAGEGASQQHDRQEANQSSASLSERKRVYGDNVLPARATKSIWGLMWLALKDKVLILLSISAVVSLALGLFQDFGTPREPGEPPVDWVEGVAIIIAIAIVVLVGSLNDWQKERQFQKLNNQKEERGVKVIRGGQEHVIDVKEVVVGDIALLEPGEIIPCDGVFIAGHNVRCDESGATGESDAIQKMSYEECKNLGDRARHTDCFMVSGSKVLEGFGRYVVVAVGPKSFNGRIMMALRGDAENTPLQLKLNALAELIAKLGSLSGLLLFAALMIRFFVQLGKGQEYHTPSEKGIAFVQIMIIAVTLIVVAVPEGLPLAVTLALAFATKRMTKEKLLVRVLGSCETMANASVICTDKTGTLTENKMTVVAGSVGIHAKFVRDIKANASRSHVGKEPSQQQQNEVAPPHGDDKVQSPVSSTSTSSSASEAGHGDDFPLDQSELGQVMPPALCKLFNEAIAINSTAFEDKDPETGKLSFVGSKTETALLTMAQDLGWEDYRTVRSKAKIVQMIPFSSERKAMAVVVKIPGANGRSDRWRMYVKGASEIVMKRTTKHVVVRKPGEGVSKARESDEVEVSDIDGVAEKNITRTIIFYANQMLRTIAICYKDFEQWPPQDTHPNEKGEISYSELATDLTLVAITGLEDPLREGVREAVAKCHRAGVTVKMCTGDNPLTARSIAAQCGIYTGGLVMEGPAFRNLSEKEMEDVVPRLQVLARSSPDDKRILVSQLQKLGGIVGVTGDGTNDGPALKTADVGFSMGIAGTEVAKEASDIILMDDNFNSIVKAIMWGRCVNDAVRKFLQFQISTNVTACVITFVTAVASQSESSVLSAVQLLWINIIMDTFAALALATDPASESLLDRKPDIKTAPLFSVEMYKQIMIQSTYQIIMTLLFHFAGLQILGFENTKHNNAVIQTLVFNAFVFAQIFNSVNCRRLDSRLNVFEGMSRNWYFMAITLIELVVQVIIVFVGGAAFQVTHINGREWGISLAIGVVSLPLGALIRLLPNGPFEVLLRALRILPREEVLSKPRSKSEEWNSAIEIVRDNLGTFANVRGGRLRSSSFVIKSRSARLKRDQSALPSLMTMIPTVVATSMVAADWTSHRSSLADPAREDPSHSSMALHRGLSPVSPNPMSDGSVHNLHPSPSRGSNQR